MKLPPTSDLHQWIPKWERLVKAVEARRPRFVPIAGDLLPKQGGVPDQVAFFSDTRRHLIAMARVGPGVISSRSIRRHPSSGACR